MIDEDAARGLLAAVDASLAATSKYVAAMDDGDAKEAVQRLLDAVTTHQLLLRGHVEAHPK